MYGEISTGQNLSGGNLEEKCNISFYIMSFATLIQINTNLLQLLLLSIKCAT